MYLLNCLGSGNDTPSDDKQYLSGVRTSNVYLKERYGKDTNSVQIEGREYGRTFTYPSILNFSGDIKKNTSFFLLKEQLLDEYLAYNSTTDPHTLVDL